MHHFYRSALVLNETFVLPKLFTKLTQSVSLVVYHLKDTGHYYCQRPVFSHSSL